MIILEGADLVGKTTLAQAILRDERIQELGHVYRHLTRPPKGWHHYRSYVEHASMFAVQDRFHMSEVVYATMRGETPKISPEWYRLVDAHIRLLGGLTVVLYASDDTVFENRWREDEMYTLQQVKEANYLYKLLTDRGSWRSGGSDVHNDIIEYSFADVDLVYDISRDLQISTEQRAAEIVNVYLARIEAINEATS